LEEGLKSPDGPLKTGNLEADYLDIIQSGKRRYILKGIVLFAAPSGSANTKQYLFILERLHLEKLNLPMVFRTLELNRREQEIVQLLLEGASNKEIADALKLSINTVKGYMKLLNRKLQVNNRAGIVASIFAVK
jgi:DNA-binding CsgD family transcriptional regulator